MITSYQSQLKDLNETIIEINQFMKLPSKVMTRDGAIIVSRVGELI